MAAQGISEAVHTIALQPYDRMIGLELSEISVDGCITKAPCGGECVGRSPVDRGKQGLKRSLASDACGVPLGLVAAGANSHDSPLLGPTLEAAIGQVGPLPEDVNVNLDRGYDNNKSRTLLGSWASPVRSPARAYPPRSRPASGGPWNGRTRG